MADSRQLLWVYKESKSHPVSSQVFRAPSVHFSDARPGIALIQNLVKCIKSEPDA